MSGDIRAVRRAPGGRGVGAGEERCSEEYIRAGGKGEPTVDAIHSPVMKYYKSLIFSRSIFLNAIKMVVKGTYATKKI